MARKVWRYPLEVKEGPQQLQWAVKGKIIHVDSKTFGYVDLWVEFDDSEEVATRTFQIFGTGWEITDDAQYIGTSVQRTQNPDQFNEIKVWHVYERLV